MNSFADAHPDEVSRTLAQLFALRGRLDDKRVTLREPLAELRRQARARAKRRGSSADGARYRLGSSLIALGCRPEDDVELVGLFWHVDVALGWLARAREELGPVTFPQMIEFILAEDDRRAWFRAWGAWVLWDRRRSLYEASVQSFLDSGKADDPKAAWRSKPPTDDQIELIEILCELENETPPPDPNRGEAFEWIRERAGNPRYRRTGPPLPEDWLCP
ncbi:MAG: hypothetical protein ABIW83_07955 [Allosphingosinicella sp.]